MAGPRQRSKVKRIKAVVDAKPARKAGAADFKSEKEEFDILTEPAMFGAVHKKMESAGTKAEVAGITLLPILTTRLTDTAAITEAGKLSEAFEKHDDVKEVFSHGEFSEAA